MQEKTSIKLKMIITGIIILLSILGFSTKVDALYAKDILDGGIYGGYFDPSDGEWYYGGFTNTEAEKQATGARYSLEQALRDLSQPNPNNDARVLPMRHNWMRTRNNIYCIAKDRPFNGNRMYLVLASTYIDGNYTSTGRFDYANGKMAYVLSRNQGYGQEVHAYTTGAKSVYSLSGYWLQHCLGFHNFDGSIMGNNGFDGDPDVIQMLSEADAYAKSVGEVTATNETNSGTPLETPTLKDNTDYSKVKTTEYLYPSEGNLRKE